MMYRVLIPTAGTGSRLGRNTQFLNKSLVSIANRPTISHIIEQFPLDTEFVIALGHKGHLVKEYLQLVYPQRIFYFSEVNPYEGIGSGLGLSILTCKSFLQQPFIFTSCDTLVQGIIPPPDHNWMGYTDLEGKKHYRTLSVDDNIVTTINEKDTITDNSMKPYIGLAGIFHFDDFWNAMEHGGNASISMGEAFGMRRLLEKGITAHNFAWFDTGNIESLENTRSQYRKNDEPNILEKADEAIWFIDDVVVKFSDNTKFIENRVKRTSYLESFIPKVTGSTQHMYKYAKVGGDVLSDIITLPLFKSFLQHSQLFWKQQSLDPNERNTFRNNCSRFYKEKTFERIDLFYKTFNRKDGTERLNGIHAPLLSDLLDQINWDWLADGLPGRFHGDYHFENILYSANSDAFTFLDWRQDFGGSLSTGDIYYDLAKLLHGLIISHELISNNHFSIQWELDNIGYDFHRKHILVECETYFYEWLTKNNYDLKKVKTLTALIFLNIAALHHDPYSQLLFALGKSMLNNTLKTLPTNENTQ